MGRFDSEADLETDLSLLRRTYHVSDSRDLLDAAFEDTSKNRTGYYGNVQDYYAGTAAQLSGVHSEDGAIHFGLDWDGQYRRKGFFEQPRIISDLITKRGARDVLELGPGKGFNSVYLAERHPDVRVTGVDVTPAQVKTASERGRHLSNLRIIEGDFHHLTCLDDNSIDIAFEIEAACYSDTPEKVAMLVAELSRVLRPGGIFVAFGYCRSNEFDRCSANAKLALALVARAWVIEGFVPEEFWDKTAERAGLRSIERHDLRRPVMPSIARLYRQARMFYVIMASPFRTLPSLLVRQSTHNAVSALMLPFTLSLGALEYRQTIYEKGI